jgi:virulence factor
MNDLRLGVIGVGRMGLNHCRVINTIRSTKLEGVFDIDQERSKDVARRHGTESFADSQSLLAAVNAVSIATPTITHLPIARECVERGVHMLIEKPLAETPEKAQELVKLANESQLTIQVGHIERFNPAYRELKLLLEDSKILAVDFRRLSAYPGSNTDVDVVYDLMVHDIDMMLDLIGREPSRLRASGLTAFSGQIDHASVLVEFPGGPLVTLNTSRLTEEKIRRIDVTTPNAFIVADLLDKKVSINRRTIGEYLNFNSQSVKYRHESLVERILVPPVEHLLLQMQHFIHCIQNQEQPAVTVQDGWKAIDFVHMVQEQIGDRIIDANEFSKSIIPTASQPLQEL